ncbi:MAG: hypothetical protein K2G93_06570 [Rikenella sp.]|nr:hypothetical protein [Rikenella sp.]
MASLYPKPPQTAHSGLRHGSPLSVCRPPNGGEHDSADLVASALRRSAFSLGRPLAHREHAPAPGNRHSYYGTLNSVGTSGYCWSSSDLNNYSYYLHFSRGGILPKDGNYRASGLQLRCLQE